MIRSSYTRKKLVEMYIDSLKENQIPWRKRWVNGVNINGSTRCEYSGVNQLLLLLVSAKEKYDDPRWYTYLQIKSEGYKLKNAKGKGVPIEYWSIYNLKSKKMIEIPIYEKIIEENPEEEVNYRIIRKISFVYNATHIEGVPKQISGNQKTIKTSKYINSVIRNLKIKYSEYGDRAFYRYTTDEIVLPSRKKFADKYSYYATQLHELSHATGNKKRLDRNMNNESVEDYAREELIAEISSSFLMQKLNVDIKAEHYDNHKAYVQSWINILEKKPEELFKAINESNKVCDFIEKNSKTKKRKLER